MLNKFFTNKFNLHMLKQKKLNVYTLITKTFNSNNFKSNKFTKKLVTLLILNLIINFNTTLLSINSVDAKRIGMIIWENEGSCRIENLTFWSPYESFPSLGIGHFIWFPKGKKSTYKEQFPRLCEYFKKNGVYLPKWLNEAVKTGAPWTSRTEFLRDKQKIRDLQNLLSSTIDLQSRFIINQFEEQIPLIIKSCPEKHKTKINNNVQLMKQTLLGTYALIDYLNFKGSGTMKNEEKLNTGHGLLQVLLDMPNNLNLNNVNKAFAVSAAKILLRRIKNSNPNYDLIIYLGGWMRRVNSYSNENIFKNVFVQRSKKLFTIYNLCF